MEIEDLKKENALLKEALRKAQAKKGIGTAQKEKILSFYSRFFCW